MRWYILALSSHSKVSFPRFILRMNLKLTQIEFTSSDCAFIDHNMKVCCLENIVSRCRFKLRPVNPERIILVKYQIGSHFVKILGRSPDGLDWLKVPDDD